MPGKSGINNNYTIFNQCDTLSLNVYVHSLHYLFNLLISVEKKCGFIVCHVQVH